MQRIWASASWIHLEWFYFWQFALLPYTPGSSFAAEFHASMILYLGPTIHQSGGSCMSALEFIQVQDNSLLKVKIVRSISRPSLSLKLLPTERSLTSRTRCLPPPVFDSCLAELLLLAHVCRSYRQKCCSSISTTSPVCFWYWPSTWVMQEVFCFVFCGGGRGLLQSFKRRGKEKEKDCIKKYRPPSVHTRTCNKEQ